MTNVQEQGFHTDEPCGEHELVARFDGPMPCPDQATNDTRDDDPAAALVSVQSVVRGLHPPEASARPWR